MSNDTLKTAKRTIRKMEQAHDDCHDKNIRTAKRKERQKGKQIIREELRDKNIRKDK